MEHKGLICNEENMVMVDNIEVNTQNSIRIASRVGIIYIDPLAINDVGRILRTFKIKKNVKTRGLKVMSPTSPT